MYQKMVLFNQSFYHHSVAGEAHSRVKWLPAETSTTVHKVEVACNDAVDR
jgi:hypothetical protein